MGAHYSCWSVQCLRHSFWSGFFMSPTWICLLYFTQTSRLDELFFLNIRREFYISTNAHWNCQTVHRVNYAGHTLTITVILNILRIWLLVPCLVTYRRNVLILYWYLSNLHFMHKFSHEKERVWKLKFNYILGFWY